MKGKFFLVLIVTVIIGIHPVFAQSGGSGGSAQQAAPEKPAKEAEVVININLASDSEFSRALQTASDVELIDEETAKAEKNDKAPAQGKAK
jgi:hypothetical protein